MKTDNYNPYLSFYGKYKISPVKQDLSNLNLHLARREKLYRTLGIPVFAFQRKSVLEVGCGGGHNALAFLLWGAQVDLVEPNPKAREEIQPLFDRYNIDQDRWRLIDTMIEDFNINRSYDMVFAEGFIQCIKNKAEVIQKLSNVTKKGGVVVVTCADDISFFFDFLKRIVGFRLIQLNGTTCFEDKVCLLRRAFGSHLESLKCATRLIEDWVIDNLVNPEKYGDFFSIADCIGLFGKEFEFLGSSPRMFTEYSWYKDVQSSYKSQIIDQFHQKWHLLLMVGLEESTRRVEDNILLNRTIRELRRCIEDKGNRIDKENFVPILSFLKQIQALAGPIDSRIVKVIDEVQELILDEALSPEKISNAGHFRSAFGRGQQYVSMVKKSM